MSSGNDIIISPEPLKPRIERLRTLPGNTLAGALRCAIANEKLSYTDLPRVDIKVNGVLQPKTAEALDRCLMDGDLVVIDVRVHGDNPLRTAFQIFVQVAAAIVGSMFGPWAAAAVQVAGALLTNVLFPPNKPEQLADANDSGALRDQSNNIRRRYPMPLVLGRQRIGFDVAALGYSENIGDESWINVIFGLHYGPCTVEDIKIGETLLADYPANDYQIEYFLTPGPRNSNIYKQSKFQENLNNELTFVGNVGTWEVGTLQPNVNQGEVDITLPNGLHFTDDKGRKGNEEIAGTIQIAEVGTESWVAAAVPPAYNKNGALLPAGSFYVNAKTQDAIRRTYTFILPDATKQYKVRVRAYDADNLAKGTQVWDTFWTALRSVSFQKPIIDEILSCVVLRVRSSGDLNGTLPTVTGVVTPIVPIFSGGNWNTEAPSSNMAACLRWALTGPAANTPLDPEEINESCASAYSLIEANDWKAGIFVIEDVSQEDLMKVCGAAGRFSTYWSGEDLCFVSDWAKPIPRQVFTHKNVSGYKYRREYQDEIHAIFVEFKNLDESSGADEVWVYADGYNAANATEFETMRLPYACTLERAYKEGRVYLAKRELKTEVHEFTAAFDGVTATYGDRVLVSHPAALFGKAAGRVVNRIFNADKTQVVGMRVDFLAEFEPGTTYSVDVRRFDQAFVGISVVNPGAPSKTITFTAPRPVADAPLKDDLVVFGETNIVTEDVEIDDFNYADSTTVRISASPYVAELVEIAETGPIPPITTRLKPKQPTPKPRIISSRGLPDGAEVLFDVAEDPAVPIQGFVAKWRYSGGSWNTLPLLGSDARSVKTPPIQRPSYEFGDPEADAKTLVDIQILTLARRGDYSNPVYANGIIIEKIVPEPTGFDAIGVVRVSPDGSSYPAIAVIADAVTAGDIQYLDVELAEYFDSDNYRNAGPPMPASLPFGDYADVQAGENYVVRARWRTQDNWVSDWVYKGLYPNPVLVPGNSNVSTDSVFTGGVPSSQLVDRVIDVEDLTEALELASSNANAALIILEAELDAVSVIVSDPTTGLTTKVGSLQTIVNGQGIRLTNVEASASLSALRLSPSANLLPNPTGGDGLRLWTPSGTGGWTTGTDDEGAFFRRAFPSAAGLTATLIANQFTGIVPGDVLTVSAVAELTGRTAGNTFIQMDYLNNVGGIVAGGSSARAFANGSGPIVPFTATAPAGTVAARVQIVMDAVSGDATADMKVRRIKVEKGTVDTPFSDEATLNAGGTTGLLARSLTVETAAANLATGKADAARVALIEARAFGSNLLTKAIWVGNEATYAPWGYYESAVNFNPAVHAAANGYSIVGEGSLQISQGVRNNADPLANLAQFSLVLPVEALKSYCWSVYSGAISCMCRVIMYFTDAGGNYISESPQNAASDNNAEKTGSNPSNINNLKRIACFATAPANAVNVVLLMRKHDTIGAGTAESYAFFSRMMFGEVQPLATTPPPWAPGSVESRVTVNEQATADLYGRTYARWQIGAAVPGATAFIQALAETTPGAAPTSSVAIGAYQFAVYNPTGADWKKALEVVGGNVVLTGGLQAGAFIRLGNGQGWPVALKAVDFNLTDGEVCNFGTDLGTLPSLSFALNNLAPLSTGETYNVYAESLTSTGFTLRAKINIPASPTNQSLTGASTAVTINTYPARKQVRGALPDSADGLFRLTASGSQNFLVYGNGAGFPQADNEQYIQAYLNIYGLKGGVWTLIGNTQVDIMVDPDSYPTGPNYGAEFWSLDETFNFGTGCTEFAVARTGDSNGQGGTINALTGVYWQSAGAGSGIRSATPSGQKTKVTVRPQ